MSQIIDFFLVPFLRLVLAVYDIVPFSNFWKYKFVPTGLIKLIVHRTILEKRNLYKAPVKPIPEDRKAPTGPPNGRPADGFGTDWENPTTAMEGAAIGRNMPALPKHLRDPHGKPEVQMLAQRLLAREEFKPAAAQLNVLAASWLQAMVHDWIGHFDDQNKERVVLDKGEENGCPMRKFTFKKTLERDDGHYDSERTNWWDASFVYGNNATQLDAARTYVGGKMITNDEIPHALPTNEDGSNIPGDNKNSWVGVALLQEVFLREHNWVATKIVESDPGLDANTDDQKIFDAARVVVSALVAKIHTTDWTVELLKTRLLDIGMNTNWVGILDAVFGIPIPLLTKMGKSKASNQGTPFCLTEEFAAVYRLHSLSPPGLILGDDDDKKTFVDLSDLVGDKGRATMRKTKTHPKELMKSCLSYPCGGLYSSNYPDVFRNILPTADSGVDLPETERIDLAALDLYRDRERGILKFNEFRRQLYLKPYKSFMQLTNKNKEDARKLELMYGPGQAGVEKCDLLIGSMYEAKVQPSFALSETSFIVFLLMASRRLEADPFLNEFYTEEYYTKFGLDHVKKNKGFLDLLERHYPDLAKDFKDEKGKPKQSAFKPTLGPEAWTTAIEGGVVDPKIVNIWAKTKEENKKFFDDLEEESTTFYKNLKSNKASSG